MDRVQRILEGEDPRAVLEQKEPKGPRNRQEIEQLMVEALEGIDGVESAQPADPKRAEVARVTIQAQGGDRWALRNKWEKENGQLRFMLTHFTGSTTNPLPSIITPEDPTDQDVIKTIRDKVSQINF